MKMSFSEAFPKLYIYNTVKSFFLQPMFPPKPFDIISSKGGCSEGLDTSYFSFEQCYPFAVYLSKYECLPRSTRTCLLYIRYVLLYSHICSIILMMFGTYMDVWSHK